MALLLTQPLIAAVGFAYPAFQSFKALRDGNVEGGLRLLVVWVAVGALATIERLLDPVLSFAVPLYGLLKLAAVLWLVLPVTSGADRILYKRYVEPRLRWLLYGERDMDDDTPRPRGPRLRE